MRFIFSIVAVALFLVLTGCTHVKFNLFVDKSEPLQEFTLSGSASEKILVIPIDGIISNHNKLSIITEKPGTVENVVAQLRLAADDDDVKAVLLKIDSPGGLTTASDILYNEIMNFKRITKKKVVVSMLDMAASGGYMAALPGDLITAHPTTVTGSVGVIFMRPQVSGLMDKLGLGVEITKSGRNKDMGSPFRPATEEECKLFQSVIDQLDQRFLNLVQQHRHLSPENLEKVKTARIFTAVDALKLGLIDKICYLKDALNETCRIAGIPEDARVVAYRRIYYPNDNIYNTSVSHYGGAGISSGMNTNILTLTGVSESGFYAIWPGAVGSE